MKNFAGFDFQILLAIFIVAILGLSMIWSLVPNLFVNQLAFFLIGLFFFFLFSRLDFRVFEHLSWIVYATCLVFLVSTFLFGQVTRGSIRWIQIGNFTIQPSEIVKPFLVCFFASLLEKEEKLSFSRFVGVLILLSLPLFFIFKQPDLGSTLVVLFSFLGILLASNVSLSYIFAGLGFILVSSPVFWFFLKGYQKVRILSFLNPYLDPLGSGYHLIQSVITTGSGQFLGRGLGKGTQSHLAFLPEHHTDFIFASLSEELGFLGAAVLLLCYFLILFKILKIGRNSSSPFGVLVCFGTFSLLLFQIFVNIGMNMGILPITGITLPLVSYGGSSALATMISLGIVESIAKAKKPEETIEIK